MPYKCSISKYTGNYDKQPHSSTYNTDCHCQQMNKREKWLRVLPRGEKLLFLIFVSAETTGLKTRMVKVVEKADHFYHLVSSTYLNLYFQHQDLHQEDPNSSLH